MRHRKGQAKAAPPLQGLWAPYKGHLFQEAFPASPAQILSQPHSPDQGCCHADSWTRTQSLEGGPRSRACGPPRYRAQVTRDSLPHSSPASPSLAPTEGPLDVAGTPPCLPVTPGDTEVLRGHAEREGGRRWLPGMGAAWLTLSGPGDLSCVCCGQGHTQLFSQISDRGSLAPWHCRHWGHPGHCGGEQHPHHTLMRPRHDPVLLGAGPPRRALS